MADTADADVSTILAERLASALDDIVRDWLRLTNKSPWTDLSVEDHVNHLPELLGAIVILAAGDEDAAPPARQRVVVQGFRHGVHRRISGFEIGLMVEEYHLLRQSMWNHLVEGDDRGEALTAILRVDHAISVATIASMVAYSGKSDVDEPAADVVASLMKRW